MAIYLCATDRPSGETLYARISNHDMKFRTGLSNSFAKNRTLGLHLKPSQGTDLSDLDAIAILKECHARIARMGQSWVANPRLEYR